MPNYCYFKDRCELCVHACEGEYPHMVRLSPTHEVSCYRYYDNATADAANETAAVLDELIASGENEGEGK